MDIEEENPLNQPQASYSKTVSKPEDQEVIETLHGEIYSLKNMMDQKDNLLQKMSNVFKEKDLIINELKHQLHNSSVDDQNYATNKDFRHIKRIFQPSPGRKNSGSQSERSIHSLVYLLQKTQKEEKIKKDVKQEDRQLSESNTQTLSGSSTTSIVNKWYDKSWKQDYNYQPEYDSEDSAAFERDQQEPE